MAWAHVRSWEAVPRTEVHGPAKNTRNPPAHQNSTGKGNGHTTDARQRPTGGRALPQPEWCHAGRPRNVKWVTARQTGQPPAPDCAVRGPQGRPVPIVRRAVPLCHFRTRRLSWTHLLMDARPLPARVRPLDVQDKTASPLDGFRALPTQSCAPQEGFAGTNESIKPAKGRFPFDLTPSGTCTGWQATQHARHAIHNPQPTNGDTKIHQIVKIPPGAGMDHGRGAAFFTKHARKAGKNLGFSLHLPLCLLRYTVHPVLFNNQLSGP